MSTILKALKRLDEQRRADAEPRTLEDQVLSAARKRPPADAGRRRLFMLAGAVGGLALGGAAWVALRPPLPPPVASAAPTQPAPAPSPLPAAAARAPREALPAPGEPVSGTELDAGVRAALRPRATRGEGAPPPAAAGGSFVASGRQPEAGLGAEVPAAPPPAANPSEPPAPLPQFAARSARESATAVAPAPTLARAAKPKPAAKPAPAPTPEPTAEPAPEAQKSVAVVSARPEIWVEGTQWHPTPAKRSARVRIGEGEPRELHEGDAEDGVVVKEIRPSGVVFLYEGEEFKRGVGGS